MIMINVNQIDDINQIIYNEYIFKLDLNKIKCSCSCTGKLKKHGYYKRNIKIKGVKKELYVLRVKCNYCNKTHAILLSSIIPYKQILLIDCFSIIKNREDKYILNQIMAENLLIDESNIQYVIKQYNLLEFNGMIEEQLMCTELSFFCFVIFDCQFLQIKKATFIFETT